MSPIYRQQTHAGCLNRSYSASLLSLQLLRYQYTEQGVKSFKIALLRSEHIIRYFGLYQYFVDSLPFLPQGGGCILISRP